MSELKRWLTILLQGLVLALAGALLMSNALAQEAKPEAEAKAEPKERKDLVLKGDAKCTRCHDEGDDYPVLAIGKTKHGTVADGRTPTCTSCHGESERHVNKPADSKERPRPDRTFTRTSSTPIAERNGACMSCHRRDSARSHWDGSTHQTRDVACATCHQVHTQQDRVRNKLTQAEVCFTCQGAARADQPSVAPSDPGRQGGLLRLPQPRRWLLRPPHRAGADLVGRGVGSEARPLLARCRAIEAPHVGRSP